HSSDDRNRPHKRVDLQRELCPKVASLKSVLKRIGRLTGGGRQGSACHTDSPQDKSVRMADKMSGPRLKVLRECGCDLYRVVSRTSIRRSGFVLTSQRASFSSRSRVRLTR